MYRLDQGQSYIQDKQTSLEDRYYNNQSFQEEYPVNDPEVNHAATKIQAKFRGHKARQNVEKLKQDNQQIIDTDQQELGYNRAQSGTPNQDVHPAASVEERKQSPLPNADSKKPEEKIDYNKIEIEPDQIFPEELTEEEKEEQERAARSIQARFRGFQSQRSASRNKVSPDQQSVQQQNQGSDNERTPTPSSTRLSGKIDSDRQDLGGNLTANDQNETGEDADTNRPRLEREPTQLSEDFERHTQVPRDSDFNREERPDINNDEDDMNDPTLDKAATRIQASYRGYKTRKDLGSAGTQDQQQNSSNTQEEYDKTEGNKEPEGEEDDNAAAVKIQAAFRGYRTRKDLEK